MEHKHTRVVKCRSCDNEINVKISKQLWLCSTCIKIILADIPSVYIENEILKRFHFQKKLESENEL